MNFQRCVKLRFAFRVTTADGSSRERVAAKVDGKWFEAIDFVGFTQDLNGPMVAVSDVVFYADDGASFKQVPGLVLGVLDEFQRVKLVVHDGHLVDVPGERYVYPTETDNPKAEVIPLHR